MIRFHLSCLSSALDQIDETCYVISILVLSEDYVLVRVMIGFVNYW
jgi:hypothetical protein